MLKAVQNGSRQNAQAGQLPQTTLLPSGKPVRPESPMARMQRAHGNQGMQRLLGGGILQKKLTINQPGDVYEQEADRVADAVMRMPDPAAAPAAPVVEFMSFGPSLQRCSCGASSSSGGDCDECKATAVRLQRSSNSASQSAEAPPIVHEVLRSPGQPLDRATCDFMAPRFGYDFSKVRLHADARGAESARAVDALAYTVGSHVVVGSSEFSTQTYTGQRLLAHELTHVIQQTPQRNTTPTFNAAVQRQSIDEPAPLPKPSAKAPEFGEIEFDPECPKRPTRLGDLPPEPACPEATDDIDGERFRFCKDTDVFQKQDDPDRLKSFARNQKSLASFNVYGYASKDGATQYNLNLSCHRAKRVARDLMNAGVPSERVRIAARGETERFSTGNSEKQLAPNRVVVVGVEKPPTPPSLNGPLPTDRAKLVEMAIDKIEAGDYRLAADAYLSFWSCGRVPNLREAIRRTRIVIKDGSCPTIPGHDPGRVIIPSQQHPISLNTIELTPDMFCTANPLDCVIGRIIDLSFHHMVRQQIKGIDTPNILDPGHRPALFLIELAGFPPCQTTDGQLFWSPVTTDPMQGQPDPPCAPKRLPGPLATAEGQGRVPRTTPGFRLDSASFKGNRGPIQWTQAPDAGLMEPSQTAFEAKAKVTLTGDQKEFKNYEIGYVQTIIQNDVFADYVSGHRVNFLLSVPIRDGPPAKLSFATPPWFDARFIATPDAKTGEAQTHMSDSPSRLAPLEFFEKDNVLDRLDQHVVFNNWLVARRKGAPLDRFDTFFLDGTLIDFRQKADVIAGKGNGSFEAKLDVSTDVQSMQISGPTPADLPQNLILRFHEPVSRDVAGGDSFQVFAQNVNTIAEPHRRSLGLLSEMTAHIRINVNTGHVELDTPALAAGVIKIATTDTHISGQDLKKLAVAIFPEARKLVLAALGRANTLADIPIILRKLSP